MATRKTKAPLPSPKRPFIGRDDGLSDLLNAISTLEWTRDKLQKVVEDANDLFEAEAKGTAWSAHERPDDKAFALAADLISIAEEIPLLLEQLERNEESGK